MTIITNAQYWIEVESVAANIACEAMQTAKNDRDEAEDIINDSLLHETIDGHEWIIYTAYHLPILQISDNTDYYIDNFGSDDAGYVLKNKGLDGLHQTIAFFAFYADVNDKISEALDDIEDSLDNTEE